MTNLTTIVYIIFSLFIFSCGNSNSSDNLNVKASLPDSFEHSPRDLKVITSFINRQVGTMSTLYGNQLALQQAIEVNHEVLADEIFTLVTWKQQPDAHWFGANIPGDLLSVEIVKTTLTSHTIGIKYEIYEGKDLTLTTHPPNESERIKFILEQKPSVMP